MAHIELVLPGLLIAVAGLTILARALRVPYPIFLVIGGLGLGFVPGLPEMQLEPELAALLRLRRERKIGDEAMRRVERDLDLEHARLET